MSDTGTPPERVRVTGPPRRRTPGARTSDIDAGTRLGGMYLGSLLREQFRLALGILALLAVLVGTLPLAFHLWPGLSGVDVLGIPLAWWLLGVLVYPTLLGLGWAYVRRAERNEHDFAELMSEMVPEEVAQQPSRRMVPEEVAQQPSRRTVPEEVAQQPSRRMPAEGER